MANAFDLYTEIRKLLFDYKEEKFVVNQYTGKQQISQAYVQKIKMFTLLKNLMHSCTDMNTEYVDVSLIKSFVG